MRATPECFAHLTQLLQVLANGRVCAVLEVTGGVWRVPSTQEHGSQVKTQSGGAPCLGELPTPVTPFLYPVSTLPGWLPPGVPGQVSVHDGTGTAG